MKTIKLECVVCGKVMEVHPSKSSTRYCTSCREAQKIIDRAAYQERKRAREGSTRIRRNRKNSNSFYDENIYGSIISTGKIGIKLQ